MTTLKEKDVDGVPVLCEECGSIVTKKTVAEANKSKDSHDNLLHDGDDTAVVVEDKYDVSTDNTPSGQKQRFIKEIMSLVE